MKRISILLIVTTLLTLMSCEDTTKKGSDLFALEIVPTKKSYKPSDEIQFNLKNLKGTSVERVSYTLNDGEPLTATSISLANEKLGSKTVTATITTSDEKEYTVTTSFNITAEKPPVRYTYKILETYPHDIGAYTQGLEFKGDTLYESTGQRGKSSLRKSDLKTGKLYQKVALENQYFGEGLTILNNKVYQLTWQSKTGFIYDPETLERKGTFVYGKSKEGWGLCNDGTQIYKSDGTEKIWTLNPETLAEESYIEIFTNTNRINKVNELEWVDGLIYANIYQKDAIAMVNPASGAVEGVIVLKGLQDLVAQHESVDVLNGIAYKGEPNILYVTGKNWDKLFKIEIVPK